jgi:exopolyphosphatase/guanosine-5'-triphosphate,3'-diphosphate pyrophosphatase
MPVLAAIDVGSNAIRLLICNVGGDRRTAILESVRDPVRLGGDVFTTGLVSEASIERAVEAFVRFRGLIDKHGARWIRGVATSAIREALNKDLFLDRIAQASGIEISVIGCEEEARLIHLAVISKISLKGMSALLVDIGGGSAEVTLTDNGNIISTECFRMGAVRLLQLLEEKERGQQLFHRMVSEYVDATQKRVRKELGGQTIDLLVGTGGNIEALGELRRSLLVRDRNSVLSGGELDSLVRKLQSMTLEERIRELQLRPDRADVIVPAAMVLQKFVKLAGVSEIQIPGVGLKDGLLADMIRELHGEKTHTSRDQVITSAIQLGRKYLFDEQHALTTARLAVKLFDETKPLHNLSLDYRLLLEAAALLHDIGQFVNVIDHHKHTQYLLAASPVIGLDESQMAIVGNVARYHRKSLPKPQHELYRALSSKNRVVVSKLAAILRLADAMDNEHGAKVQDFAAEYKKPKFTIKLQGEGDLLLEKWALMKKAAMFEEIFSLKLLVQD